MQHSVHIRTAERRIERRSQTLADEKAQLVAPERMAQTISEYVEWRAFSYWARLIVDIEGHVSETLRSLLDTKCQGFLAYASSYRQRHPGQREFFWLRLIEVDRQRSISFRGGGGLGARVGLLRRARDSDLDRVRKYWAECDDSWKTAPPPPLQCRPTRTGVGLRRCEVDRSTPDWEHNPYTYRCEPTL